MKGVEVRGGDGSPMDSGVESSSSESGAFVLGVRGEEQYRKLIVSSYSSSLKATENGESSSSSSKQNLPTLLRGVSYSMSSSISLLPSLMLAFSVTSTLNPLNSLFPPTV
jgi:hypothetical protein